MKHYHVVCHRYNGKFVTYSIYKDNEPYLMPEFKKVLGKKAAYAIAKLLNNL